MPRLWLKAKRRKSGIEVVAIIEKTGISRQYYNMLESGKRNPSVVLAQKIGELLGFDWTWFFNPPAEVILDAKSVDAGIIQHK